MPKRPLGPPTIACVFGSLQRKQDLLRDSASSSFQKRRILCEGRLSRLTKRLGWGSPVAKRYELASKIRGSS